MPGDKSLSHRAILLAALADGTSHIDNWLEAGDTRSTLHAIRTLGVPVDRHGNRLTIDGGHLFSAHGIVDFGNTGTGLRLTAGILAGQNFAVKIDGSEQLRRRPMQRIAVPLRRMGAIIHTTKQGYLPWRIEPAQLHGIHYSLPVASAQVKSAVLLAALFAQGKTTVVEPLASRDHTERLLKAMDADIEVVGDTITLVPGSPLRPIDLEIPGDFSSAAFPIVAAATIKDSDIMVTGVNYNPRRLGLLRVLQQMAAEITVVDLRQQGEEPIADLRIRYAPLQGVTISGQTVVDMIDEFPIFMVAALQARGRTVVRDATELRVKESDRLAVMIEQLEKMGARIEQFADGFAINAPQHLHPASLDCRADHRVAMSLAVAALNAVGESEIQGADCAVDSFPDYPQAMSRWGILML